MKEFVEIKEILSFLSEENIEYTFIGNENDIIEGFSTLFNYKEGTITFISTFYNFKDYVGNFQNKKIKLIITDPSEQQYDCFENSLIIERPTNKFFTILEGFFDSEKGTDALTVHSGEMNERNSFISESAIIGDNVQIGFGCVIEPNVNIGDNTTLHHNVVIKSGTKIGRNCEILSGTVIGERGFNPFTLDNGEREMIKHFGGVTIEDDVSIGVNCSVHKGAIDDTYIGEGVKLNAMVHISHNCNIGKNTVITMPTQVCGSVNIGENCHIAATTIRNQCTIGDNAVLGLGAVVVKNVESGVTVVGNPAKPLEK